MTKGLLKYKPKETAKKFWAISLVSLTSLFFTGTAQAAETEIIFDLPADLQNAGGRKYNLRSKVLNLEFDSLEKYIETRTSPSVKPISKNNPAIDYLARVVLPKLTTSKPVNAIWEEKDGKLVNFNPGSNGQDYNIKDILAELEGSLTERRDKLTVNIITTPPEIPLEKVNSFGIKELVASGTSDFKGSSNNRIKNIKLGSSKFQGLLVAPGATFAFNEPLGPVDGEHGFAPELVIKKTGLVPEFGGGICQVSTTVFRAALYGGLPVVERRNHSFAVQYYAPQGTDATIYPGVQDLKFTNDTPGHILIWSEISGTKLTFNFYGQSDGRKVVVEPPVR